MNNKHILGQTDLENEITKLEETLKIKKQQLEKLRLVNENGKYVLISTGEISQLNLEIPQDTWEKAIKQNNTFKTKKDAEKERDRRALLYEFNQFRDECNGGEKVEMDSCIVKYYIGFYDGKLDWYSVGYGLFFNTFGYFHRKADCLTAIKKFGDRIKKLYID